MVCMFVNVEAREAVTSMHRQDRFMTEKSIKVRLLLLLHS